MIGTRTSACPRFLLGSRGLLDPRLRVLCSTRVCAGGAPQFGVIKGAAESERLKKLFQRLLAVAILIICLLIGAMLGMGIVAGEAVKESHVSDAELTALSGEVVGTQVVSDDVSFFNLPNMTIEELEDVTSLNVVVDGRCSAAFFDELVEATFQIARVVKATGSSVAAFHTATGDVITIDADTLNATLTTAAGASLPIADSLDDDGGGAAATSSAVGRRLARSQGKCKALSGKAKRECKESAKRARSRCTSKQCKCERALRRGKRGVGCGGLK